MAGNPESLRVRIFGHGKSQHLDEDEKPGKYIQNLDRSIATIFKEAVNDSLPEWNTPKRPSTSRYAPYRSKRHQETSKKDETRDVPNVSLCTPERVLLAAKRIIKNSYAEKCSEVYHMGASRMEIAHQELNANINAMALEAEKNISSKLNKSIRRIKLLDEIRIRQTESPNNDDTTSMREVIGKYHEDLSVWAQKSDSLRRSLSLADEEVRRCLADLFGEGGVPGRDIRSSIEKRNMASAELEEIISGMKSACKEAEKQEKLREKVCLSSVELKAPHIHNIGADYFHLLRTKEFNGQTTRLKAAIERLIDGADDTELSDEPGIIEMVTKQT